MDPEPANPFVYGAVARGDYFADREQELDTLLADVRGGQDVVIISPRRLGKTSLVDRAIEQLRAGGTLVAYLDLFGTPTQERLADRLAQELHDGLLSPIERKLDRVRDWFSHLSIAPRITVGDDGRPQFEFLAYERRDDAQTLIEGLLELPGLVAAGGHRVCVVLDEFQEVLALDETLPGRIRSVFQQQPEIAHVYLGSKRHLMEPLFLERAAPLYRSATPMRIGPIAPREFIGFLRDRFRVGGIVVADEALDQILTLTGGLPYETQELCSYTWSAARLESRSVDAALIGDALETLVDAESARYVAIWDRLPQGQRNLLFALAREPGQVYSDEYRRRHKLRSASSVQHAVRALEQLDLVDTGEVGYGLADMFLGVWLRRMA